MFPHEPGKYILSLVLQICFLSSRKQNKIAYNK